MAIAQLLLGLVLVFAGAGMILARRVIGARNARAGGWKTATPVLWVFLGVLLVMNGALQITLSAV
ncbi:hypothetical protein OM076_43715 [Solirubrobacter ginsenosidimutans]|uniref:Uncharacterized protein n=1 Tax=Solirubrobacter ginsenosidimutans TaxID=490573 RepID=A0A9X3SBS3_9ACTN|nr:hypothetical protein [Solirubrobacter ginsenosidimutans]MDA0167248.1 hypothetical protein [Solirubrobacter ginsenosidimutans]